MRTARRLAPGSTGAARRRVVVVGIQERILTLIVRTVVAGAQWMYRIVEKRLLEGFLYGLAQAVVGAGRVTCHIVEQEGLEGILRRIVRAVLALSRGLQRLHARKLGSVLWIAASLLLATPAPSLYEQR